ncbi:MAG: flavin reductase [Clostridia bacterium]|nr:flavin reductase [Clostridia bacterium]
MEKEAMFKLSYGLFVLSAKDNEKQSGCIVNTVSMLTDTPKRITVFVNKANYTEELIRKTGQFNVSVLTESVPFDLIRQFGFQSGRDVDKFAGKAYPKTENGLYYVEESVNAVFSANVVDAYDYDTHTLFVAEVTEAKKLSDEPSVTYEYYQKNIKPKPAAPAAQPKEEKKTRRWVCKVCGYVYEGEELPADFVCPWCKHPAEDFEEITD